MLAQYTPFQWSMKGASQALHACCKHIWEWKAKKEKPEINDDGKITNLNLSRCWKESKKKTN